MQTALTKIYHNKSRHTGCRERLNLQIDSSKIRMTEILSKEHQRSSVSTFYPKETDETEEATMVLTIILVFVLILLIFCRREMKKPFHFAPGKVWFFLTIFSPWERMLQEATLTPSNSLLRLGHSKCVFRSHQQKFKQKKSDWKNLG